MIQWLVVDRSAILTSIVLTARLDRGAINDYFLHAVAVPSDTRKWYDEKNVIHKRGADEQG